MAAATASYRERVLDLLKQHKWEQRDLALASGLTPTKISRFLRENGTDLDVPDLERVAQAFNLRGGDLLDRSAKDPFQDRLSPIADQLRALPIDQQVQAINALAANLSTMLSWRER